MNSVHKKYLLLFFLMGLLPRLSHAQLDADYFTADRLLRHQQYEKAYDKFYELHLKHPASFIFLDKAIECLINLKRYDKAIAITQGAISKGNFQAQAMIRLGEIYHYKGDSNLAQSTWDEVLKTYAGSSEIYLRLARTMADCRLFDKAVGVYEKAMQRSPDSNIILSELAETYMQAGKYEKAIQSYLQLVKKSPDRIGLVQRRLIRFHDDNIYDIAILEISDFLDDFPPQHPSYRSLQQLEVWLLMERHLYKRALVTAKSYEAQSSEITYILYNLGSKLTADQQFELAEEAYNYYINNDIYPVKYRCMQELAGVYKQWAKYLENYNLGLSSRRKTLYQKAFSTLEKLRQNTPGYPRMYEVLVSLAELSLDMLHNPEQASKYLSELRDLSDKSTIANASYIQGRIYLYNNDYTRARIALTKSNKQERIGDLAEKTRYYLALTDFYAGDYDFAKIQLNALERQNTSYFANDAVQLRLWIQNGMAADSTGALLTPFAKAVEYFSQGKDQLGINKLKTFFETSGYNPLQDEALLELSKYQDTDNAIYVYESLSTYLASQGSASPLFERLLWEKARLADQFVTNKQIDIRLPEASRVDSMDTGKAGIPRVPIPRKIEQLVPLYEEILLHFPNGFYASYARDRIQELQKIQT
ncbi:MAG: tetratricopeptide repeat protein [Balneolaceae bacterium]|jgi:predicted Zn-dependent protease